MKCHLCESEATVHLTEIINGQMVELHLCEEHAVAKGANFTQPFSATDFFSSLSELLSPPESLQKNAETVCPSCQMNYGDFVKSGRLGCEKCYETFKKILIPLIKRVQRSTLHLGKRPLPGDAKGHVRAALHKLQRRLAQAVENENFEEAARLRDEIKQVEEQQKSE